MSNKHEALRAKLNHLEQAYEQNSAQKNRILDKASTQTQRLQEQARKAKEIMTRRTENPALYALYQEQYEGFSQLHQINNEVTDEQLADVKRREVQLQEEIALVREELAKTPVEKEQ